MIEVKNLVKRYGNHTAVNDLTFTVKKGQIYGFLGPNGAGKSTTMNMITGYLAPTGGNVLIDGHDILKEPEIAKKQIGYLPEIPPLYMDMTVAEYMKFAAELKKVKKQERDKMITEVMEMVKITDVKDRLIKNLSKGYRQRVGLAQAILGYPEIIILDEPTVGLDPKQIIEIRDLIKSLGKKHTVILSSHILSEVSAVCDHILIISKGKLVASDTPDNLGRVMNGESTLEMTVKGQKTRIGNLLNQIEGVDHVEVSDSTESGCVNILIKMNSDVDCREEIFYRFAEEKLPILEMKRNRISLEEVFLELTSKDDGIKEEEISSPRSDELGFASQIKEEISSPRSKELGFASQIKEDKNDSSL